MNPIHREQNTAPIPLPGVKDGGQAVALLVKGDKCAFYGCGIYGYQDTLYDYSGRHLFRECHIEGAVDFIFGNARSLYEVSRTWTNLRHSFSELAKQKCRKY